MEVNRSESGAFGDRAYPSVGDATLEPLAVAASKDRSFVAFPAGEV
jgi:hypothetical protein